MIVRLFLFSITENREPSDHVSLYQLASVCLTISDFSDTHELTSAYWKFGHIFAAQFLGYLEWHKIHYPKHTLSELMTSQNAAKHYEATDWTLIRISLCQRKYIAHMTHVSSFN